ncbi:MAG TPA: VOC family protein [Ramlibacter sp.]|nr:VOC family protein [Ramlibacter sp.]
MKVEPYLFLNGRCEEALEFYRSALGAQVGMLMRMKDSPEPQPSGTRPPGWENKVMHAVFQVGETKVMASDGMPGSTPEFKGFSLSIDPPDEARARQIFNALAEGGQVQMPLGKTFYSPCFGMVADRFGVSWMVIVQPAT